LGVVELEKTQITASTFMPGAPRLGAPHSIINPMNRQMWHVPVDSITLERSGISVCLSDAMRRTEAWAKALEDNLAKAFEEQVPPEHQGKHSGSDLVLNIVLGVRTDQIVPKGTPGHEPEIPSAEDNAEEDDGVAST
jgi:hypothetical protein